MARPPLHTLQRPEPRITANELARYMVSSPTGQIGIIRRAYESVTPQRVRYSDVRRVIRAHLGDSHRPHGVISTARDTFDQRSNDSTLTNFSREDARLSVDVLDSYLRMQNQLGGYAFTEAPRRQPVLMLSGVAVAVNLDLLITRSRGNVDQVGGALFRFTKAEDETDSAAARRRDMGMYAATLVHMQVQANMAGNRAPNHQICMSIDVQCEEVHIAPRTFAQRASNLENACRFIAALWGQ